MGTVFVLILTLNSYNYGSAILDIEFYNLHECEMAGKRWVNNVGSKRREDTASFICVNKTKETK